MGVTATDTRRAAVTVSVVEPEMPDAGSVAVTLVVPGESVAARPFVEGAFDTDATEAFEDAQVRVPVRSCVEAFVYVPMAVNCVDKPSGVEGTAGVTAIETRRAAVTVSVVEPEVPLAGSVALITVDPTVSAVVSPAEPAAFEMLAVGGTEDCQLTVAVRSCVVLSVYVPVAANWCVRPTGSDGVAGVTAIDTSCAAVTVSVVVPERPEDPSVALIVADPIPAPVATPFDPAVLENRVTAESEDPQVTVPVRSRVVESVYVPVAVSCCLAPSAMEGSGGVIASEVRRAAVTVKAVLIEMPVPGSVTVMVVVPVAVVEATPAAPAVATVATSTIEDDHLTLAVMSCVVESVYVPTAVNCW